MLKVLGGKRPDLYCAEHFSVARFHSDLRPIFACIGAII